MMIKDRCIGSSGFEDSGAWFGSWLPVLTQVASPIAHNSFMLNYLSLGWAHLASNQFLEFTFSISKNSEVTQKFCQRTYVYLCVSVYVWMCTLQGIFTTLATRLWKAKNSFLIYKPLLHLLCVLYTIMQHWVHSPCFPERVKCVFLLLWKVFFEKW